jgi:DNA mismatch repair ATPase MutS
MKALLMHRDEDFDLQHDLPANEGALTQDLELDTLFNAMALGDQFLFDVAKRAVLCSLADPEAILYRQQVLADCLKEPSAVREMYDIAVEAFQAERRIWRTFMNSPDLILHTSLQVLELFVPILRRLRTTADEYGESLRSEGFARLFAMLGTELDDGYFGAIDEHLRELKFRRGTLISAQLGKGNKGVRYVLRTLPREQSWMERIFARRRSGYSFEIPARDESGFRALTELRERGINLVANALAGSADHILSFFNMLRTELAFYVGCLNLHAQLVEKGQPTCFPIPVGADGPSLAASGLYDVSLAFHLERGVVGNDVNADGKSLVMITGANQGGKSTFLRSTGLAQLMMQAGIFVGAQSFRANVCDGLFTHYKREEDSAMESGKLDEELRRMSEIADQITPNCILLCNESFASTNEREGSEIARQVVQALTEAGIKILYVTHLFDLAHSLYAKKLGGALFLRAERRPDGLRTFRLIQGEPLPTSYGEDSYRRIFGIAPDGAPVPVADRAR